MLVSGQASCEAFGKLTAKPQPLWFSPLAALWHLPLPARTLHINPVDFETGSLTKQSFYSTNNSKLRSTNVFSSEAPFPSSPPAKQLHFPSFWTSEIRKKNHPYECSHPAPQLQTTSFSHQQPHETRQIVNQNNGCQFHLPSSALGQICCHTLERLLGPKDKIHCKFQLKHPLPWQPSILSNEFHTEFTSTRIHHPTSTVAQKNATKVNRTIRSTQKKWVENKSLIYSWFYTYHPRVKNYCSKKFELPRLGFWYSMSCHGHSSQVALQNGHGSIEVWFNVNNIDLLPYFTNRTLKQNWLEALHDVVATWCFFSTDASYSRSKQKKMVSFFDHFGGF